MPVMRQRTLPEPTDRLGNTLVVGDLICYILHNFLDSSALLVGVVTKISPRSKDVYAKNIKLSKNESVEEKKITGRYSILKLDDNLKTNLIVRKLSEE